MANDLYRHLHAGNSIDHLFFAVGRELTAPKVAAACDISDDEALGLLLDYTRRSLLLYTGEGVFIDTSRGKP